MLPPIDHCDLWIRDMLLAVVNGSPLEGNVAILQNWHPVDMSSPPKVPRGIIYTSRTLMAATGEEPSEGVRLMPRSANQPRHSSTKTSEWLKQITGAEIAKSLRNKDVLNKVLPALAANPKITAQQLLDKTGVATSQADIDTAVQNLVNSTEGVAQLKAAGYEKVRATYQRKVFMDPALRKIVTMSQHVDAGTAGTGVVGMLAGVTAMAVHKVSNGTGAAAAAAADDDDSDTSATNGFGTADKDDNDDNDDDDNSGGASGNGNVTAIGTTVGSAASMLATAALASIGAADSATGSDAEEKLKRKREKAKARKKAFRERGGEALRMKEAEAQKKRRQEKRAPGSSGECSSRGGGGCSGSRGSTSRGGGRGRGGRGR